MLQTSEAELFPARNTPSSTMRSLPSAQLTGEVSKPLPAAPEHPKLESGTELPRFSLRSNQHINQAFENK